MTPVREIPHAHDPVNIGQWMLRLKPDFVGRAQGGAFMAVFSYRDERKGFLWSVGYSDVSLDQARGFALNELAKARFDNEIELLLIDV